MKELIRFLELSDRPLLIAGLMSGTSLDGLDIALCQYANDGPLKYSEREAFHFIDAETTPFPANLRKRLLGVEKADLREIALLDQELGRFYAKRLGDFCSKTGKRPDLIGLHGQTIFHEHGAATMQIGEPSWLAQASNCPVVSDFRKADLAAGGCGAPLVPVFDQFAFGRQDEGVIALNIGGIANLTAVPAGSRPQDKITAFDTGPGNMLIDGLVEAYSQGKMAIDDRGIMASRGRIREDLVEEWMSWPFFSQEPPRSAGREDFGALMLNDILEREKPQDDQDWFDLLASATWLTAFSIAGAIRDFVHPNLKTSRLIVGGGGVHNQTIMGHLKSLTNDHIIEPMEDYGVPPDFREAMAFAFLPVLFLTGQAGNLIESTGASHPARLGKLTLP